MTRDEILEDLRKRVGAAGFHHAAELSGIPRSHLYEMLSASGNPTLNSLMKLCNVFNLVVEIRERAGNGPERNGT